MSVFNWCSVGDHANCKRTYERFIIDPKTSKVVWLGETVECGCLKRGCECYTKPADRAKPKRKTRRKS